MSLEERIRAVLCRHFVVNGVDGLNDRYNAAWWTIRPDLMDQAVADVVVVIGAEHG